GYGVADAVVDEERLGGFRRVLVVLERDVTRARDLPDDAAARLERLPVLVEDDGFPDPRHGRTALHRRLAGLHHDHAVVTALRRADRVDHHEAREALEEL